MLRVWLRKSHEVFLCNAKRFNTDAHLISPFRTDDMGGPSIGPSAGPGMTHSLPPPPASLPAPPHHMGDPSYSAATVSAGPQPASMGGMGMYGGMPQQQLGMPAPVMLPPLHYTGADPAQPFSYQPSGAPAPGMHPSRMANLAGGPGGTPTPPLPQAGMVRSADQMMSGDGTGEMPDDGVPPAKRQRVARLPGGQYYPEQNWIDLHPVSASIFYVYFKTSPDRLI